MSFGEKLMNAVIWLIFRSMTFSICIFYLNLVNGFSGQQPIESFIYAMINVNMTPLVIFFYIIFEVELNRRKYAISDAAEKLMPYTMSDLYQSTRQHVRKFYLTHLIHVLYAFYTGAVIFIVYYMGISESGGVMSANG